MVRELPREAFSRHPSYQQQYRHYPEPEENRVNEVRENYRQKPPMLIDDALRDYCHIDVQSYFLVAHMRTGKFKAFSGPGPQLRGDVINQFFNPEVFQQVMDRQDSGASPMLGGSYGPEHNAYRQPTEFSKSRATDRRRHDGYDDWDGQSRQGRKRPRARHPMNDERDAPMAISRTRTGIKIGNSNELWNFYERRFKNCQQTACKILAKAWVKAVEPKKQSTHPYTGSDEKAPDWWPKPWGPTKEDKVRHKEPDHLYKRERVHLLSHILRMVMEPNENQHSDIQKLNLNVKKLEEITNEALSPFFVDTENPANAKKRPYVNEIFKVAKLEERYKNGEIDGTAEVYVMSEDKMTENYGSENDEGSFDPEDDESSTSTSKPVTQNLVQTPTTDQSPASNIHGGPYLGDLPVRGSQFAPPMMTEVPPEQHSFDSNTMAVNGQAPVHSAAGSFTLDMVTSPQDTSRRPSLFSEHASPTAAPMYTTPWQQGSTAPNSTPTYTYTTQQPTPQSQSFVGPPVQMNPTQSYMASPFDGLPRATEDAMFRQNPVPQATVPHTQSYEYMSTDGRGLPSMKVDAMGRNPMQ